MLLWTCLSTLTLGGDSPSSRQELPRARDEEAVALAGAVWDLVCLVSLPSKALQSQVSLSHLRPQLM